MMITKTVFMLLAAACVIQVIYLLKSYNTIPVLSHAVPKCSCWKKCNSNEVKKSPLIKLNPNKLLFSYLPGGPTNQKYSFINAVFLAIQLNR